MKYNCIIILGPTASGKTKLSVELAKLLNGEVINADSQQIIKGLNIGTAKITPAETEGIKHHLFDIIDIGQDFSVSEYRELAIAKIKEVLTNGKLPIIVGGTGFYINSLLYNYTFGNSNKNEEIREHYEQLANTYGKEYVYNLLKEIDPKGASKIEPNDLKRVIRAIEIFKVSGTKKSDQILERNNDIIPFIVGIDVNRDILYDRINHRVDKMMNDGLESEITFLKDNGFYDLNNNYQLPIGYSEWSGYFTGELTKEEVINQIKADSRHYAKRQITWFKRVEGVNWYTVNSSSDLDKVIDKVKNDILNNIA